MHNSEDDVFQGIGRHLLQNLPPWGVGNGVIALAICLFLSVVLCACGSHSTSPRLVYATSTGIFLLVLVILVAAPKGEKQASAQGYDNSIIPRVFILILMIMGVLLSFTGLFTFHWRSTIYARSLNYQNEVLMYR